MTLPLWTPRLISAAAAETLAGVAVSIAGEDAAVTPFAASARDDGRVSRAARRTARSSRAGREDDVELAAVDEAPRRNRVRAGRRRIALAIRPVVCRFLLSFLLKSDNRIFLVGTRLPSHVLHACYTRHALEV